MGTTPDGIRSLERRNPDRSLMTEQRVKSVRPVVPFTQDGARVLGHRYWLEVSRLSRGLIRCRETMDGVELTALGLGPALLRMGGPTVTVDDDAVSCTYRIRGGLLAVGEAGTLVLSQAGGEEPELRVLVDSFFARLGGGVLFGLQRRVHAAVSRRYFRHLLAEAQT